MPQTDTDDILAVIVQEGPMTGIWSRRDLSPRPRLRTGTSIERMVDHNERMRDQRLAEMLVGRAALLKVHGGLVMADEEQWGKLLLLVMAGQAEVFRL